MTSTNKRGRPRFEDILTPAEWRVANGVRHGMTNREIAERRGVSVDAVKLHVSNILQKLGYSKRQQLKSWDGVSKNSRIHNRDLCMHEVEKIGKIGQISRSVDNIDVAREWYENTLGLEFLYAFEGMAFFDCAGIRLFLNQGNSGSHADSILYFRVPDIHRTYNQLTAKGVIFTNVPHLVHKHDNGVEEWMAFFDDPEGRPMGLMSQSDPC